MATTLVIKDANFAANKVAKVSFDGVVPCTGIELDKSVISFDELEASESIVATLTPSNTTDEVVWSSSDDTVASVSNGVITAMKIGRATITATCGTQTATCNVEIEVIPDYVVVGAFNPYKAATGIATTNNIDKTGTGTKNGIIAANNADTNEKRIDCYNSEDEGNYRFVPIKLPAEAKRIKVESKMYSGSTLLSMKTRFLWFDSTKSQSPYTSAKCLDGKGSSAWDQDSNVTSYVVDIPINLTGLDSFAIALNMSDWSIGYNINYAQYFDITILPEADE